MSKTLAVYNASSSPIFVKVESTCNVGRKTEENQNRHANLSFGPLCLAVGGSTHVQYEYGKEIESTLIWMGDWEWFSDKIDPVVFVYGRPKGVHTVIWLATSCRDSEQVASLGVAKGRSAIFTSRGALVAGGAEGWFSDDAIWTDINGNNHRRSRCDAAGATNWFHERFVTMNEEEQSAYMKAIGPLKLPMFTRVANLPQETQEERIKDSAEAKFIMDLVKLRRRDKRPGLTYLHVLTAITMYDNVRSYHGSTLTAEKANAFINDLNDDTISQLHDLGGAEEEIFEGWTSDSIRKLFEFCG